MGSGEHSLPQSLSVADELAQFKSRWLTKHSNMTFAGEQSRTEIQSGAEWKMHTVPAVPQHDGVRAASEAMFRQCISWPEKKKLKSKFSSIKSCRSYILFISFSGWRQQSLQLQVKSCPAPLLSVAQHKSPAGICFVLVLEPSLSLFDSKAKTAITELSWPSAGNMPMCNEYVMRESLLPPEIPTELHQPSLRYDTFLSPTICPLH